MNWRLQAGVCSNVRGFEPMRAARLPEQQIQGSERAGKFASVSCDSGVSCYELLLHACRVMQPMQAHGILQVRLTPVPEMCFSSFGRYTNAFPFIESLLKNNPVSNLTPFCIKQQLQTVQFIDTTRTTSPPKERPLSTCAIETDSRSS